MDKLKKTFQRHALSYSSWYPQYIFVSSLEIMIKIKLMLAEYLTPGEGEISKARLEAIQSIKGLLSQIDHLSEKVPLSDSQRFLDLLTSLKGAPLNIEEKKIALEISG